MIGGQTFLRSAVKRYYLTLQETILFSGQIVGRKIILTLKVERAALKVLHVDPTDAPFSSAMYPEHKNFSYNSKYHVMIAFQ